jgi:hypothetical protein
MADDRDLDDLLAGRSELSRLYRETRDVQPPAHLDARVLSAARREARRSRPWAPFGAGWGVPVGAAAVVVLSLGLLSLVWRDTEELRPARPPAERVAPRTDGAGRATGDALHDAVPALRREEADMERGRAAPAPPPARDEDAQGRRLPQRAPAAASGQAGGFARAEESDRVQGLSTLKALGEAAAESPKDWLARIRALLDAGDTARARTELARFLTAHPGHPLPEWAEALHDSTPARALP